MIKAKVEQLAEEVHNAWWMEKKKQGFHCPNSCPTLSIPNAIMARIVGATTKEDQEKRIKFKKHCDRCHTDMYPYHELPEHVKEYDRVTVRSVIHALNKSFGSKVVELVE